MNQLKFKKHEIPKDLLHLFKLKSKSSSWILRSDVIWFKPNHMPESVTDRFTKSYEHFYMFSKDQKYYFNLNAVREPITTTPWTTEPGKYEKNNPRTHYKGKMVGEDIDSEALGSPRARNSRSLPSINDICPACGESLSKHRVGPKNLNGSQSSIQPPYNYTIEGIAIKLCNPKGKNPGDLWQVPTQPFSGSHFAVFPEALVERIIKCSCPPKGVVLDPFAGSGTALKVARRLGRNFIGIELNSEYAEMAEQRIRGRNFRIKITENQATIK